MNRNKLSIIIVNYNVSKLLHQCLNSIYKTVRETEFEIFVVDNNSLDDSVEMIKRKFPSIKLIENKNNVGFPRANNQAIKLAKGEYILFINPDTIVMPNAIEEMVNCLDLHKDIGAVGPMTFSSEGRIVPDCARNFPTILSVLWRITGLETLFPDNRIFGSSRMTYWDHKSTCDVECISGACMMVHKNILDEFKGFVDVMYAEDIDLCYRIKQNGWKIRYLTESKIVHYAKQSSKNIPNFWSIVASEKGLTWFFLKHYGYVRFGIVKTMFLFYHFSGFLAWGIIYFAIKKENGIRHNAARHWRVFKQVIL